MNPEVVMFRNSVSIESNGEEIWDFEALDFNRILLRSGIPDGMRHILKDPDYDEYGLIKHLVPTVVSGGTVEVYENGSANLLFCTDETGRSTGFVKIRP